MEDNSPSLKDVNIQEDHEEWLKLSLSTGPSRRQPADSQSNLPLSLPPPPQPQPATMSVPPQPMPSAPRPDHYDGGFSALLQYFRPSSSSQAPPSPPQPQPTTMSLHTQFMPSAPMPAHYDGCFDLLLQYLRPSSSSQEPPQKKPNSVPIADPLPPVPSQLPEMPKPIPEIPLRSQLDQSQDQDQDQDHDEEYQPGLSATRHQVRPRKLSVQPLKHGKSSTIEPPYPWSTTSRANVHSMDYLLSNGMNVIAGDVQCTRCEKEFKIEYDLRQKFFEVAEFIRENKYEMRDRAPKQWMQPVLPNCRYCGEENCAKPLIDKKRLVNWLFLLLGQLLGCCKLKHLKYFCKHIHNHRTGAKDRVLYQTYLGLCKQLDPTGPFD